jgi:hypothetical protein
LCTPNTNSGRNTDIEMKSGIAERHKKLIE